MVKLTRENFYAVGEAAGAMSCWGLDAPSPGLFFDTPIGPVKANLGDWVTVPDDL